MGNFWDYNVWSTVSVLAVLLLGLLAANALKKNIRLLRESLVPTSVLAGVLLLVISTIYEAISGTSLFETGLFGQNGTFQLEVVTYHCLALGFVATSFRPSTRKFDKKRGAEIFNTGVTTVSMYLIQAVLGMGITVLLALFVKDLYPASGLLLPFGYGQGTGQALNYGNLYETDHGFVGGKSFGLTIAALGFLSASIGGVVYLNILRRQGKLTSAYSEEEGELRSEEVQGEDEIPMQGSMDKMTIELALVFIAYLLTYGLMFLLGRLLPGMRAVIYGFNFLLGVLSATLIKLVINLLRKKKMIKRGYVNDFLMTRISNFFFDLMVVAGIAAIRLGILEKHWGIMLILGVVGLVITYAYNYFVAKKLFPRYSREQFLMMFGMLTGTASTGTILLREIDGDFKTPAADNMVYQNFPAIVFGFPMMLLATLAPTKPFLTWIICLLFLLAMNVLLFRRYLFRKRRKKTREDK